MKKEEIKKELTEIAPGLTLPTADPYQVPEGYFAGMQERLFNKLEKKNRPSIRPIFSQFAPRVAAVLILVAGIIVGLNIFTETNDTETGNAFASLSAAEAEAYITDNLEEFDELLLAKYLPVEDSDEEEDVPENNFIYETW